jgi:hypothetical protein
MQAWNHRRLFDRAGIAGTLIYVSSHRVDSNKKNECILARCVAALGVLATLAAIRLHWVSFIHAGGLWRDEVGMAGVAAQPSLSAVWRAMPHESFPILAALAVRGWCVIFGWTDMAIRSLGFATGLFFLAGLWLAGRLIWKGVPLLALTLFGLNAVAIRYVDAIRGYGPATACIVLTIALVWRFVEKPDLSRAIWAAAMATVSVQVLYQNAVLVLALCLAGCGVFLRGRRWREGAATLAIGVPAALSFAPYISLLRRSQDWWIVSRTGVDLPIAWSNIISLVSHPLPVFRFVWMALLISAVLLAGEQAIVELAQPDGPARRNLSLFAAVALVVGLAGFGIFLLAARLPTQPWYFLVPAGFAIFCCDAILSQTSFWMRAGVAVLAAVSAVLAYPAGVPALEFRQTNGDIVAAELAREAAPDDLIIVNPWYCGITFDRYYHGQAPWTTLSGVADQQYHRFDLIKIKMETAHAARPVLDRAAATLESGHRVWIVGWIPSVTGMKEEPADLPPIVSGPGGRLEIPTTGGDGKGFLTFRNAGLDGSYSWAWGAQLSYLIVTHAETIARVPVDSGEHVSAVENMGLTVASGWKAAERNRRSTQPGLGGL